MAKGHYSGTCAASNMSHHGGKVAGAGELTFGTSPGKRAMKTKAKEFALEKDSGKSKAKVSTGKPYSEE